MAEKISDLQNDEVHELSRLSKYVEELKTKDKHEALKFQRAMITNLRSTNTNTYQKLADQYENQVERAGSVLEEFSEYEEVIKIIDTLESIYTDQISVELAVERFTFIFDEYQEQPHLLDPHLEKILDRLLSIARSPHVPIKLSHLAFKCLYLVIKTRGFKIAIRHFPHEVVDLEPVLSLLRSQDQNDSETWESRYMLLLWLSIVCMIPFDMAKLDGFSRTETGDCKHPIMESIINMAKLYLSMSDKSRDAAAYALSKFMTRHDVKQQKLPEFLDWCLRSMIEIDMHTFGGQASVSGILSTMALLFKNGKREDLVSYAGPVLEKVLSCKLLASQNTQIRKLAIKLVQRLGLTFLKTRVASWRYQRGSRSLIENLSGDKDEQTSAPEHKVNVNLEDDEDEGYDVPEEIEEVLDQLLQGLRDKDTVVRWSAAKGVGRITGRLPQELAEQVVESVLDLFTLQELDTAWHGGCLSLAELGRRGLLVPEKLPQVVPVVLKALIYDQNRGSYSVGANVRDAACYVCWSFARAYDPTLLKPHVEELATALIIVAIFDREVNCRRAASAAFQENVGRQGTFPHGIDILTTADYFAVGNRFNTYLTISVYIAQFEEYTKALIDHLINIKIAHWERKMRELTSESLHNLTPLAMNYMATKVMPYLVPLPTGIEINSRHGSLLALGEITHALFKEMQKDNKQLADILGEEVITGLKQIVVKITQTDMLKGLSGEQLRPSLCRFIQKLSLSKLPIHDDIPLIDLWHSLLNESFLFSDELMEPAMEALEALCSEYYLHSPNFPALQERIISKYLEELKSENEVNRRGFALATGALPQFLVSGKLKELLQGLIGSTVVKQSEMSKFVEARRDAFKAIIRLCQTVGINPTGDPSNSICASNLYDIYRALFGGMKDFTLDNRGDVGAWVREVCMTAMKNLTCMVFEVDSSFITSDICETMFCYLVQQSCEKIDRTRACAGESMLSLLYYHPPIPNIPHRKELLAIFPEHQSKFLNWCAPADCFPKVTQMLSLSTYSYHVLLGLTVSVGGLTESLVKHSSTSLLEYIKKNSVDKDFIDKFSESLLTVFKNHSKYDRISLPFLKMMDILLANSCFEELPEDHPFSKNLLGQCKLEIEKCTNPQKLLASIDVFCGIIQFGGQVSKKCLSQLAVFLCHRYPRVRKSTADKLYETLLTYDADNEENVEEAQELLGTTQWDLPVPEIRPVRNQLCTLLGIPQPVLKSKKTPAN